VATKAENEQPKRPPCGLGRRVLVMIYDGVIMIALWLLATGAALLAGSGRVTAGQDVLFTAYLLLVGFLYLAWCWRKGMTVGMRAWRVSIEREDGLPPGWGACLLRFAVSLLSAACLGLGFVWSLFDPHKRTWHDLASGTRLLRNQVAVR
jgi:uncharacterized RDD family membrane protein YckC